MNVRNGPLYTAFGTEFGRALTANAAAQTVFEHLSAADLEKLRRRVERASTPGELREIVDALAGSAPGHPPYQL